MDLKTWLEKPGNTQSGLADRIGVTQGFVSQMALSKRPVPPRLCRPIEAATDGAVTAAELRPDVFGPPAKAA